MEIKITLLLKEKDGIIGTEYTGVGIENQNRDVIITCL